MNYKGLDTKIQTMIKNGELKVYQHPTAKEADKFINDYIDTINQQNELHRTRNSRSNRVKKTT
jgi:hypothetical protein